MIASRHFQHTFSGVTYLMLLFSMLCGGVVPAQADVPSAMPPFRVVLPAGVRLILKPETEVDRVAVSVFVHVGADDSLRSAAIGEMVARTLFYGNANRTQNSIQALASEVGGSLDVLRAQDFVAINYVTVPAQLPEALHLICDCLKNAQFAPESLKNALQAIRTERANSQSANFTRGYATLTQLLGQEEPEEASLNRVTQAQAQAYFQRHYTSAQTVISLAGRFEVSRVQGYLNAFLADYNRPSAEDRRQKTEDRIRKTEDGSPTPSTLNPQPSTVSASGPSAYAFVGTSAPSADSADYAAFTVLQALLGGGHASRLFQQARETLGLGYEVGALYAPEQCSALVTYLQWNTQRDSQAPKTSLMGETARQLLHALLDGVIAHPPTEEELTRARNVAIGQDALRHERVRNRAFLLGWYETVGKGYAYDAEFPRRLAGVTREEFLRIAKKYLGARASVLVLPPDK